MESIGNGFMMCAGTLHNNSCLAIELEDESCQFIQFLGGVTDFKRRGNNLAEGAQDIMLFPLKTSIPTAFICNLQILFAIGLHPLLIADSICLVTRTPHGIPCWFNLPKPNATTRGWLTVSFTDVDSPKEVRQTNSPLIAT